MKQIVICLFLIFSCQIVFAQDELTIDYDAIKLQVENENSNYFYPKLLGRFNSFDETLTLKEYALIYYGFSFQNDYLKQQPNEAIIDTLLKSENYEQLVTECAKILKKNPVSLKANNNMGFALFKLNKPESEWEKYQNRYRAIRKVIVLSGNGLSCETAFKVIYVSDEYNMIYSYFDIEKIYEQSLVNLCDKFEVEKSEYYQANEIFFDISRKLIRQSDFDKELKMLEEKIEYEN
ncbi:MAG: DUF4919 domain-containing protein [Dysgonamonadaceae bacterium]|jgi:hypothetical protein|nr:DUF4919 domain-containing protein [Dysgonamonadaceae bacterium]